MSRKSTITMLFLVAVMLGFYILWTVKTVKAVKAIEPFYVSGLSDSTEAIDSAPSTSEVKGYYKTLLLYTDNDFKGSGVKSMRLLGDLRDRLFGPRNFRDKLKVDDILKNWPKWIPPLDTTTKESVPTTEEAVNAELRILSYLQKNFPMEPGAESEQGSIVRGIIDDFGYRFVFEKGKEKIKLKDDFLRYPLTRDWVNPTT